MQVGRWLHILLQLRVNDCAVLLHARCSGLGLTLTAAGLRVGLNLSVDEFRLCTVISHYIYVDANVVFRLLRLLRLLLIMMMMMITLALIAASQTLLTVHYI